LQATTAKIEDWSDSIILLLFHLYIALQNMKLLANRFKVFFETIGARFIAVDDYNTISIGDPDYQILKTERFTKPSLISD
jgi:hypothetical protein